VQFVEKYISKQLSLFESLKAGKEEKISFENLWMLFDAGDTIYSRSQQGGQVLENDDEDQHVTKRRDVPQAYRVLATVGGIPLTKTFAPKTKKTEEDFSEERVQDLLLNAVSMQQAGSTGNQPTGVLGSTLSTQRLQKMKKRYTPLYIYSFYIDFNGSKYGTVAEVFVLKPYDREVDIRSLEVYPLHYLRTLPSGVHMKQENAKDEAQKIQKEALPMQEDTRTQTLTTDVLLERGRRFIDVTAVSHMNYEGLTVGDSREEVCVG
jgi:hypothetical protein